MFYFDPFLFQNKWFPLPDIDGDTFNKNLDNAQLILYPRQSKSFTIKKGTPICQIIPFRREEWVATYQLRSYNDFVTNLSHHTTQHEPIPQNRTMEESEPLLVGMELNLNRVDIERMECGNLKVNTLVKKVHHLNVLCIKEKTMSVRLLFPTFVFERNLLDPNLPEDRGLSQQYMEQLVRECNAMRRKDPVGRQLSNQYTGCNLMMVVNHILHFNH